jgi:TM2 domain-containing membrane protein YozV
MALDANERLIIETRVASEGPNIVLAYFLWFFLGWASAHRFYLRRPGSALLQIVLMLLVVGVVWWAIDVFLIPGLVAAEREAFRARLVEEALAAKIPAAA